MFEDEVHVAIGVRLERMGGDHVGVRELADHLRFLAEAHLIVAPFLGRRRRCIAQQFFDSHIAIDAFVIAEVDRPIAALADDRHEPVFAYDQSIRAQHDASLSLGQMGWGALARCGASIAYGLCSAKGIGQLASAIAYSLA